MVGVSNIATVTGINVVTKAKSVLRLSPNSSLQRIKTPREPKLPNTAIEGLKAALTQCKRPPKQLQSEADNMYERYTQRRFPASKEVILSTRSFVVKKLRESGMEELDASTYGKSINKGSKEFFNSKVAKALKQLNYTWKPLDFGNEEKAAAYALALLSANFSEVYRVLCEFDTNKFVPETVLDFGSGIGSSFWACNEKFGPAVKEYTLVDSNQIISQFAMDIMRSDKEGEVLVHPNVNFRRSFVPSLQTKYDLVISHRSLIEFANPDVRLELIKALWERTNKYLIFIESHMFDSFEAIIEARDHILDGAYTIDHVKAEPIIKEYGVTHYEINEILNNKNLSKFEKFCLIKSKFPDNVKLPTTLEPGHVFAPCPHDKNCPKLDVEEGKKISCNFAVKYKDIRADGKKTKLQNGTGSTSYSYVILEKGPRPKGKEFHPRLVKYSKGNKHYNCHGCTAFHGIQHFVISAKNKSVFQLTKGLNHGDKIPYKIEIEKTLSEDAILTEEEILNLQDN
uniref:Methyltransferase-like protein 17, mitochondrial (inferred by orthology to a human protein) n=1 Tax=Strongyloides venezuelensis TaxID=75913 RepID=A0A0K0G0D2_STRVS